MSHNDATEGRPTPIRSDNEPLTQVGHEGNPVLCDLALTGVLDGTPALVPPRLPTGGSGATANLPLSGGGGGGNCYQGTCAEIFVTGGTPPYQFSTDVGEFVVNESGTGGTVCEGANPGSGESGIAFAKNVKYCCTFTSCSGQNFGCNGQALNACSSVAGSNCGLGSCACSDCATCSNLSGCVNTPGCSCREGVGDCDSCWCCSSCNDCCGSSGCECLRSRGIQCDLRSAGMISAGCNPCQTQFQEGAVVTVIDSAGVTLLIPLEWDVTQD